MATPQIVKLNVTQTQAPLPNALQQTGLMISQGSTTTAAGTITLLTQLSDLTAILTTTTVATASVVWSGGIVTVTTAGPHGLIVGDTGQVASIVGVVPAGYNGYYPVTVTSATVFTYPLAVTPGVTSVQGTVIVGDEELLAAGTTYFSQGSYVAVYVLELGVQASTGAGIASLTTFISLNPGIYYAILLPKGWANDAALPALLASEEFLTAKLYFIVTVTAGNYTTFTPIMKDAVCVVEAPGIGGLEFVGAAILYMIVSQSPSNVQRVGPFCFKFLYGVTPYPLKGNAAFLTTLRSANVNYVSTGAEGGITNAMLYGGTTMDGRDFLYWYSVDWVEINIDLDVSNEIINGSNNQINPLYYDQPGVDRLTARAQQTMVRAITFGLALAPITVNAIGFQAYAQANPSDYRLGIYKGLSVTYTPNRGFQSVTFNVNVSDFPTV